MWYFLSVVASIFNIAAAFQLLRAGTFIKTAGFKLTYVTIALFFLGELFKIQHWPGSQVLLLFWASALVLGLLYIVHALKKEKRQWIDALKAVWIFAYPTATLFKLEHWPYWDILSLISLISIAIVYFHFIFFYREIKDDSPLKVIDEKLLDQELID